MKSITILSKNQLNLNFWTDYLALELCDNVVQFQQEEQLLEHLQDEPTFILVDSYFHENAMDAAVSRINTYVMNKGWNTVLIHLSPRFASEYWSEQQAIIESNLNTDLINYINAVLIQQQSAAA